MLELQQMKQVFLNLITNAAPSSGAREGRSARGCRRSVRALTAVDDSGEQQWDGRDHPPRLD